MTATERSVSNAFARVLGAVVALALLAAACGDSATSHPETIDEYVSALTATVDTFDEEAAAAYAEDYPLEEELIEATGVFAAYQKSLDAVEAITPPPEIAAEHDEFVSRFTEMQEEVAHYLDKAMFEEGFTLVRLNAEPAVAAKVDAFFASCDELADKLRSLGAEGVPTACAQFSAG